jgi:hypothetical protein
VALGFKIWQTLEAEGRLSFDTSKAFQKPILKGYLNGVMARES